MRVAIEAGNVFSFLLWGPPGVGKTTLAHIYAESIDAVLFELSAVSAKKADVKKVIDAETNGRTKVLFLDEIHRFNKAQQDFLLPYVESGALVLIGATTENPSFEVISALLSRCRVFSLHSLATKDIEDILSRTDIAMDTDTKQIIAEIADGDARQAISIAEQTQTLYKNVTVDAVREAVQGRQLRYDKGGEEHYNTISAFIKSMRASQADAALYYLARMIAAGEDPKFIARRMVIFASEDIGLAQPTALVVANAAFRAVEIIGLPECEINLAHAVAYLAAAKKSRVSYSAYRAAQADVKKHGNLPIPMQIRNAPTKLMKDIGYGKGYEAYTDEDLRPEKLHGRKYLK